MNNPYYYGHDYDNRKKKGLTGKVFLLLLTALIVSVSSIVVYEWVRPVDGAPESLEATQSSGEPQKEGNADAGDDSGDALSLTQHSATTSGIMGVANPADVAEKVIPSVVCIQNLQRMGRGGQVSTAGEGSGIVLSTDGYIVTNAHVVDGAAALKIVLSNESVHEAKLIGSDAATDLALIKIDTTGLVAAELGDSSELRVGEYVLAVGNPGGMEFSSSVTMGIVSAIDRPLTISEGYTMNTIQTDAAINPGNSGGALVNMSGQVVGISSAKYVATGYEGLGFAISIDDALPIIADLRDYGYVKNRGILGVSGQYIDAMMSRFYNLPEGMYIDSVTNSEASALQQGDVIVSIDGQQITSESSIKAALANKTPQDTVEVEFYRSAVRQYYTAAIGLCEAER